MKWYHRLIRRACSFALLGGLALGCSGPGDAELSLPRQKRMILVTEKRKTPKAPAVPRKKGKSEIIQVQLDEPAVGDQTETPYTERVPAKTALPLAKAPPPKRYPIDLPAALRLAGGNNLQIAIAIEKVKAAHARLQGAQSLWMPSVNLGVVYNKHDGQLQDTRGSVVEVQRSSLFVGGGLTMDQIPLAGAANGPARLFVGLPLADVIFAPLAERQRVEAAHASQQATFHNTLLEVALAYLNLLYAEGKVTISEEAIEHARELLRLVEKRVEAGQDLPADKYRAEVELANQRQQLHQAESMVGMASAELVRLLRLDPAVVLFPLEKMPVPVDLVNPGLPLQKLIAQGVATRPEVAAAEATAGAYHERMQQEKWRPWIPTLQVGLGSGGFGGGRGSFFGNFQDRVDFDALAVWEIRNLGFGNKALQRERSSQYRQAALEVLQTQDRIAAEVSGAYHRVKFGKQQIQSAKEQVIAAAEAIPLNFKGIFGGDLRAIEAQQAVRTLAMSRMQYLAAILDHNRAQFELLRSIGQVPPEHRKADHGPLVQGFILEEELRIPKSAMRKVAKNRVSPRPRRKSTKGAPKVLRLRLVPAHRTEKVLPLQSSETRSKARPKSTKPVSRKKKPLTLPDPLNPKLKIEVLPMAPQGGRRPPRTTQQEGVPLMLPPPALNESKPIYPQRVISRKPLPARVIRGKSE